MPHVVSIAFKSSDIDSKPADRFSRASVERVVLKPGQGIVGDVKGGPGKRQLNVMFAEAVVELEAEGFHVAPGELGEQIVIAGLPIETRTPGAQLRIGISAVISLDYPRTGCARFERIQQRSKSDAAGRLGMMARVLVGGEIVVGDEIEALGPEVVETQKELFGEV
jgi:MOSC domain-containing protein YiiM